MTHTVIKKVEDYTQDEYRKYCEFYSLLYVPCYLKEWAIVEQTKKFDSFVADNNPNHLIKVSGTVNISRYEWYQVIPRFLTLKQAIKEILTPDVNDVEMFYCDEYKRYYVNCYHGDDLINIFEFSLSDKK